MSKNTLETTVYGEPTAKPPLLVVHGLFGSGRNWGVLSKRLAADRQVVAVDMRNHGNSFWDHGNSYFDMADDLARTIAGIGGRASVLGHSMGGKASMVLALTQPDYIENLIVADIAPIPYTHAPQENITAMRAVDLSAVQRRGDADLQLQEFVEDPSQRAFLLQSLSLKDNTASWKLNLDALEAAMPDIVGFPEMTGQFERPTLFLHGGASDYVLPEHTPKIREHFPRSEFEAIEGAGHWLHAEKPREFLSSVDAFLHSNDA